jgi:hypothetical protein
MALAIRSSLNPTRQRVAPRPEDREAQVQAASSTAESSRGEAQRVMPSEPDPEWVRRELLRSMSHLMG